MLRRTGSFLGTALAAALLLLALQGLWARAAFIVFPHTWTQNEVLTSTDLNAQFNAVQAQVNGNLDDSNVSVSAAIDGTKIATAPNGIGTAQINDRAVTIDKLAIHASVHTSAIGAIDANKTTTNSEQTYGSIALVTRGGQVVIFGTLAGSLTCGTAGASCAGDVTVRLKRDGMTQGTWLLSSLSNFTGATGYTQETGAAFPVLWSETPSPGAHTYTVTIQGSNSTDVTFVTSASPGALFALELA